MSKGGTGSGASGGSSVGLRGFGEESGCTKERSAANRRVPVGYRDDTIDPEVLGKRRKQVRYDSGCRGVSEGGGKVFVLGVRVRDAEGGSKCGGCGCETWFEVRQMWMRRGTRNAAGADAERASKCGGRGYGKGLEMRRMQKGKELEMRRMRKGKELEMRRMGCGKGLEVRQMQMWKGNFEMRRIQMWKGTRNAVDAERERELGMRSMRKQKVLRMRKILRESAGAGDDVVRRLTSGLKGQGTSGTK
ncbi:hypothetical protein FIBSPDRAFT_889615 [Athelia psychrophila]|uniref:Uncharacterized protein n=1 Tax=Athelia psychrophila TaxID=1759441 RepID=A0A166M0L2_9AGAM|nr:hypothetical protein FIBSPDRAFT_889615 [Fibularhizoctonia sp. CBS 109695]